MMMGLEGKHRQKPLGKRWKELIRQSSSMVSFKFLSVREDKTLAFMQSFNIAREHYVVARVCLQQRPTGIVYSGCLLAEQCVEMFVKAILHLDHKSMDIHYLPKLLERGEANIPYFQVLLTDPKLSYFIQNLMLVNSKMRFGEEGFDVEQQELTQVLDEVAFNLHGIYLQTIGAPGKAPLYVPHSMKEVFLRDNKYFSEEDTTDNPLATMSLGVKLPEFPPK